MDYISPISSPWWEPTGAISFLLPGENGIPEFIRRNHAANCTRANNASIQEWQEATGGTSLLETDGNMGLVLADLINGFGLDADDQ